MKKTRLLFFAFSFLCFFIFTNSCTIATDSYNPNNKLKIFSGSGKPVAEGSIFSIETCEDDPFCIED